MGLTMDQQKGVAREKAKRYRRASRKKKGRLIEDYLELTGCTRHHAAWLLRCWGTTVWDRRAGRPVKIVVGQRRSRQRTPRVYDQQTVAALTKLWRHFGYLCGKRLAATLRLWLPHYERWDARSQRKIALSPEVRAKLLRISPATIDRLLRTEKRKLTLRGRSHTKKLSGSLMLQIPIRTFSEWQNVPVGTLGVDLVGHDGGSAQGEFAYTLLATDRCTQWTEMRAVPNKAQKWVFEQLLVVRRLLPFDLLGIHSDSGGEFINAHLLRYCQQHQIHFTRSRAYRKNDNNFTEQKNFDVVRKHVGYARYDTPEAVALLNELYDRLRLMVNFVRPCAKLIEKTRHGARVRRRYDRPQTPYQRVLACEQVPEAVKQRLREQFAAIDPIALNDRIVHLQRRLLRLAAERATPLERAG